MGIRDMFLEEDRKIVYHVPLSSGVESQVGLHLLRVGKGQAKPKYRRKMIAKDTYTIQIIIDGSGMIQTPKRRLVMSGGDVIFFWQGYPYEWWTHPKDLLKHYWMDVQGGMVEAMFQRLPLTPTECVLPRSTVPDQEIDCFERLIHMLEQPTGYSPWQCMALIFQLFHSVQQTMHFHDVTPPTYRIAYRAKTFIETHYVEDISVGDVAAYVNVSTEYLSTLFKREYGMSPYEYVIECRLNAATRLLRRGAAVKDAAASVGYLDASYFSRLFLQKRGISPGTLRKGGA